MSTAAAEKARRVVFVGNIPYGVTEETLIDTFSRVGPVISFRLVHDNATGKPKGFGFMEFADPDAAASAVRNLNNTELGGRQLRVDWSNDGRDDDPRNSQAANGGDTYGAQPAQTQGQQGAPQSSALPPLPTGVDVPVGLTATDAISRTLSTLPPSQLLDIISQMKGLVMSDPSKATELLKQAPQLSYAIFQALLLLGLVDTSVLSSVLDPSAAAGQPVPPPIPPPQQQYAPAAVAVPTPPPGAVPAPPAPAMDKNALIQQVLSMPQSQIDMLGPMERQQIMALRAQFGGGRV